jgi:Fe-S oxidoreductase
MFNEENVRSIITTSPDCYKAFLKDYPEMLPDWKIEVKNIWKLIADKLESKSRLVKVNAMELVTFHDNCYLGRYCNVYDEPRKILNLIGYEVKELPDARENSICCGSCGGLARTNPELASKIARQRILQAKRLKIKKMIVTSLDNYKLLKRNAQDDVEVLELSEVLAIALGLKKREREEPEEETVEGEQEILDAESSRRFEEELVSE